jgi:hypothetical protein
MSLTDDQKIEHHRRFAEATGKTLEWMHTKIDGLRWETRSFSTTTDGWLWQAAIRGLAPGGELCAHTCMVVHLDERGLITHLEEYIDPAQMAPLRA